MGELETRISNVRDGVSGGWRRPVPAACGRCTANLLVAAAGPPFAGGRGDGTWHGLGPGQRAQPPDLVLGAAHPLPGALGTAGGAAQCERKLRRALLLGAGEPLPVNIVGELGELVHVGHLLCCQRGGSDRYITKVARRRAGWHQ